MAALTVLKLDAEAGVVGVRVGLEYLSIREDINLGSDSCKAGVEEVHLILCRAGLKSIPLKVVDLVRGLVAVMVEACGSLLVRLGTKV